MSKANLPIQKQPPPNNPKRNDTIAMIVVVSCIGIMVAIAMLIIRAM